MKRNFFICSNAFQLFNSIQIIKQLEGKNYLLLLAWNRQQSELLMSIALNYQKFEKVSLIKLYFYNVSNFIDYFFFLLRSLFWIYKKIPLSMISFDKIFITNTDLVSRIIAYRIIKKSKPFLFFYDEGIGTYIDVCGKKSIDFKNKILKLIYGYYLIDKSKGVFVYQPSLMVNNIRDLPCYKINTISRETKDIGFFMDSLLVKKTNILAPKSVLYFDSAFMDSKKINKENELFHYLKTAFPDRLFVKPHPIKLKLWNHEDVNVVGEDSNFEIMLFFQSFDKITLVSIFSTACILPKILFDEEPEIILLFNLFLANRKELSSIQNFFNKTKALYRDKNKFFVPETFNEFKDLLSTI